MYHIFIEIAAYAVLAFSLLFLLLAARRRERHMMLWGIACLFHSAMFILDTVSDDISAYGDLYSVLRELFAIAGSWIFLRGSLAFFQKKSLPVADTLTGVFAVLILLQGIPAELSDILIIPNLIFCSGLVIVSSFLFLLYSWDKSFPEKIWVGTLLMVWSILMNQTGFGSSFDELTRGIHVMAILSMALLMFLLILVDDKKELLLTRKLSDSFKVLVENFSDSMFLYSYQKKRFEYVSENIKEQIGADVAQLYAKPRAFFRYITDSQACERLKSVFDAPAEESGFLEITAGGFSESPRDMKKDELNAAIPAIHAIHTIHTIRIQYIPVRNQNGTVTAVEGILRDVTQQRLTEEELKNAEEHKNRLLENIAHEIKTPVTLLLGYTETILEHDITPQLQRKFLEMLYSKAHMLSVLADDFAQAMTTDSADIEFRFYERTAGEVFGTLIEQCRDQTERSGYSFVLSQDWDRKCILAADSDRLQQAVSNLMNNALRHTPAGSEIEVRIITEERPAAAAEADMLWEAYSDGTDDADGAPPAGRLCFYVCDNGGGIAEEELPFIFRRNYSRGRDLTGRAHGRPFSGLGLYISKNIVEAHGGSIHAENRAEGGACVWFELPYFAES